MPLSKTLLRMRGYKEKTFCGGIFLKIRLLNKLNVAFSISSIKEFLILKSHIGTWKFHNLYRSAI
jgi:hypothetical protein